MAFVRIKRIKGHDYAYLVKTVYTVNGPRQVVLRYLGRADRLASEAKAP